MVDPNVMDAPYSSYAAVPTEGTSSLVYCNADGSCPGVYENALSHLDGTAHTWPAPVMVDPNVMDAPYSSYAAVPTEGTSSLVYCNADGSCPGVYENALDHLDTTAHEWSAPAAGPDSWANGGAVETASSKLSLFYEGTCNPMPGWTPTWNPPETGCGYNVDEALALPVAPEAVAASTPKTARAAPGHLLLMSHSLLFGLASATSTMFADVTSGKADATLQWEKNFRADSAAAAESVTPVGGFLLRQALEVE